MGRFPLLNGIHFRLPRFHAIWANLFESGESKLIKNKTLFLQFFRPSNLTSLELDSLWPCLSCCQHWPNSLLGPAVIIWRKLLHKKYKNNFPKFFIFSCVSERTRVLLFATISQILMAFCFCALALLPPDTPRPVLQGFFTAVTVVSGLNCAGVGKSTQMVGSKLFGKYLIC